MSDLQIRDNSEKRRIETEVEGHLAVIEYRLAGGKIYYLHTKVPAELEGRGIASQLARFALDLAREQDLKVVPRCPFVAAFIERHPEYQPLVA